MGQGQAPGSNAEDVDDETKIDRIEADVERLRRRGEHLTLELLSRVRPKIDLALAVSDKVRAVSHQVRNVAGPVGVVGIAMLAGALAGVALIARIVRSRRRRRRPTAGQRLAKLILIATNNRYD